LDGTGAIVAQRELTMDQAPVVLASGLALQQTERIAILDRDLGDIAAMPVPRGEGLVVLGDAVISTRERVVERWEAGADQATGSGPAPADISDPAPVGPWLVVGSWRVPNVWILDAATGAIVAELQLHDHLFDAAAFAGGIALRTAHHELVWWRPDAAPAR